MLLLSISKEHKFTAAISRKTFNGSAEHFQQTGFVRAMTRRTALRVAMDKVLYNKSADIDTIHVAVEEG